MDSTAGKNGSGASVTMGEASQCNEDTSSTATPPPPTPDPEVLERPTRRRFDAAYKLRILREAEASPGQVGALLRREGLYSSHLATWRKQREDGELAALSPRKRGRKGNPSSPLDGKIVSLERENRRLKKRLARAETIIEVQKKIAELLCLPVDQSLSEPD